MRPEYRPIPPIQFEVKKSFEFQGVVYKKGEILEVRCMAMYKEMYNRTPAFVYPLPARPSLSSLRIISWGKHEKE